MWTDAREEAELRKEQVLLAAAAGGGRAAANVLGLDELEEHEADVEGKTGTPGSRCSTATPQPTEASWSPLATSAADAPTPKAEAARGHWSLQPSVGTWLTWRLGKTEPAAEQRIRLLDLPLPKLLQFFSPAGCYRIADLSADFRDAAVFHGQIIVPWLVVKKSEECDPLELIQKVSLENVIAASFIGIPDGLEALSEAMHSASQRLRDLQRFSAKGCRVDLETLPLLKEIFSTQQMYLLNLELNQMVDKTVDALVSEVLIHDESLEILNIRSNKVKDDGAESLARLANHPTLRILNLKSNSIGAPGAEALAQLLETNSNLHVLNLRAQTPKLPRAAGISLARSLCTNGTLRRIKLRRNKMDDEVAAAFVEPLTCGAARHSLLELDLQQNLLTAAGGATLARLLTKNDVLEVIHVGGHAFGAVEVSARLGGLELDVRLEFKVMPDV